MTTLCDSEIKYSRETRDYAVFVNGQLVGYGRNFAEAEQLRTAELIAHYEDGYVPEKAAALVMEAA